VTVSSGGRIVCSSPLACPSNTIGNAAGSTGTLAINGGSVNGLGSLTVGLATCMSGFARRRQHVRSADDHERRNTLDTGQSVVAANMAMTGLVTGNVTNQRRGIAWNITRNIAAEELKRA
jgi:hypothetical protein